MPAPITLRSVVGRVAAATTALFILAMLAGTVLAPSIAGDPDATRVNNPLAVLGAATAAYVVYCFRQLRY